MPVIVDKKIKLKNQNSSKLKKMPVIENPTMKMKF